MKIKLKILLLLILFAQTNNSNTDATTCFIPRSQGFDRTKQVIGSVGHVYLPDIDTFNFNFFVMPEYTSSSKSGQIAHCLFGNDIKKINNRSSIRIQGSSVENRDQKAWLADYFYLPPDFKSTISFDPTIKNFNVNLDLYLGLDQWQPGMYARIYGPISHTQWDLNFKEIVEVQGIQSYPLGTFTVDDLSAEDLLKNFTSYIKGNAPGNGTLTQTVDKRGNPTDFITTFQGLKFAKICKGKQTDTGFADLRSEFGWNFLLNKNYHLGLNIQAAAPTGSQKRATLLFDTVIGNGNYWELGGGLTSHYIFWRNEEKNRHFGFYFDANLMHMFSTTQQRTFDLCSKQNSRYMLAEKLTSNVIDGLEGNNNPGENGGLIPIAQFNNEFAPVANLTTFDVNVRIGVQADIVAMLNFSCGGLSIDTGYNFYGRSCEKIKRNKNCSSPLNNEKTWALKGDARVFGYMQANDDGGMPNLEADDPVALSATQNQATIHQGTNAQLSTQDQERNFGIDNPEFATAGGVVNRRALLFGVTGNPMDQIKTSIQPVFLNSESINLDQRTRSISHKFFGNLNYTFDYKEYKPYISIGGFGEFGKNKDQNSCPTKKCFDCALSQWGIWLKLGLSYNNYLIN